MAVPARLRIGYLLPDDGRGIAAQAAAALSLLNVHSKDLQLHHGLSRFEEISTAAEAAALGLYVGTARKAARPLFSGNKSKLFLDKETHN